MLQYLAENRELENSHTESTGHIVAKRIAHIHITMIFHFHDISLCDTFGKK